jgi:hypothetical protein
MRASTHVHAPVCSLGEVQWPFCNGEGNTGHPHVRITRKLIPQIEKRNPKCPKFCWPIAGQKTANEVSSAQMRACNSDKTREQKRARTGLVKLANRIAQKTNFAIMHQGVLR